MSTSSTLDGSIRSVETVSIEKDDAFHILQTTRRRAAIRYMLERDDEEEFRMRDMVEEIAAWEHDTTVARLSSEQRQRVYIALYQSHLPTMDDEGMVAYDDEAGTVELTGDIADTDIYMEVVPEEDIPWDLYYLGLSAANGALLALAWFEVRPFTAVPDLGWALVVLVSFAASAFVQLFYRRRMRLGDEGPPPDLASAE